MTTVITPPGTLPTWGTDGLAEITDPGASKRAIGHVTGEAPAAGHMNHTQNAYGGWLNYLQTVLKPIAAWANVEYTDEQTWGSALHNAHALAIRYDALADRWYARCLETGNDIGYQDSVDGETWNARNELATTLGNPLSCTNVYSNGTRCGVAIDDDFYLSTDNTTGNLPAVPTATAIGTTNFVARELVWDPSNGLWLLAGQKSGTDGYIFSSADGVTWTQRKNDAAERLNTIATNGSGRSVAGGTGNATMNGVIHVSDDGVTWTAASTDPDPITGAEARMLFYVASLGAFFCVDSDVTNSNLWVSVDGGDSWDDTGYNTQFVFFNDELLIVCDNNGTANAIVDVSGSGTSVAHRSIYLGDYVAGTAASQHNPSNDIIFPTVRIEGSPDKIVWHYSTNYYRAVSRIGA